jgi:glycosyltransferase involved in cell wall biosynthesis
MTIGDKRNRLIQMATGKYIAFIDDDDMIHRDYLRVILRSLELDPDVVGIVGEITMRVPNRGTMKRRFYHTIANSVYRTSQRGYERPPNHLNPMKRDIAAKFEFVDKSHGEDTDWAMRICKAKVLQSEVMNDNILYYYNFNPDKKY